MSTPQDSSSDFLDIPAAAFNVSNSAVYSLVGMSLDDNRAFIELSGPMALSVFPVVTGS
jgi:hypothetical protein